MNAIDLNQIKTLLDNFNNLSEDVQNKILDAVKCLGFLYSLSNTQQPKNLS